MKWFIGFFVLLVALVMISGCTQPAQTAAPITTVPTTVPTTVQATVATPVPTTVAPTTVTTVATTVTTKVPTTTQTTAGNVTLNTTAVITPVKTVTAASRITTIHITKTGFDPALDVVLPGTQITWVNDDGVSHSVKSIGNNEGMFTSTEIIPTAQFSYSFGDKVGTYEYALIDLPTVKGTIIVKTGSGLIT
jgi:plastocyanin